MINKLQGYTVRIALIKRKIFSNTKTEKNAEIEFLGLVRLYDHVGLNGGVGLYDRVGLNDRVGLSPLITRYQVFW